MPAAEALPAGFASATAPVNGTSLHYVAGGRGPGLILIHGFPEFRVAAVDLRGIGGSAPTRGQLATEDLQPSSKEKSP